MVNLFQKKGRDLANLRAEVGMVFQQFNLFANKTSLQNVALAPMKVRHIAKQEAEDEAMELLARVGVDSQAAKCLHSFRVVSSGV